MIYQIIETTDFLLAVSKEEIKEGNKVVIGDEINGYKTRVATKIDVLVWDYNAKYNIRKPIKAIGYYPLSDKQLDLPLLPEWDELSHLWESTKIHTGVKVGAYKLGFVDGYEQALQDHNIKIYPKQFEPIMIPEFNESSWHPLITETDGKTFLTGKYIF